MMISTKSTHSQGFCDDMGNNGKWAKWDYESVGRTFESCRVRHKKQGEIKHLSLISPSFVCTTNLNLLVEKLVAVMENGSPRIAALDADRKKKLLKFSVVQRCALGHDRL